VVSTGRVVETGSIEFDGETMLRAVKVEHAADVL
jgi:hypothetical protein